jgi:hypothetical protein
MKAATKTLRKEADELEQLAQLLQRAVRADDRDRALVALNKLREQARHAFELATYWEP